MSSAADKVWFIYITDQHEGPFTIAEIQEKFSQSIINASTLAWKDGMPEWQSMDSIPELASVLRSSSPAPAEIPPNTTENPATMDDAPELDLENPMDSVNLAASNEAPEEPSLAMQLAQAQQKSDSSAEEENTPELGIDTEASAEASISGSRSDLSASDRGSLAVESAPTEKPASTNVAAATKEVEKPAAELNIVGNSVAAEEALPEVDEHDKCWVLRLSHAEVSGMHSLSDIRKMGQMGKLNNRYQLWRMGWTDFHDGLDEYPKIEIKAKGLGALPKAPADSDMDEGDDEKTTDMELSETKAGFFARLFKSRVKTQTKKSKATAKVVTKKSPMKRIVKAAALTLFAVGLVGAGAFGYFKFFHSVLPQLTDVSEQDFEYMKHAVSSVIENGKKYYIAKANGNLYTPAFYVASNAEVGTPLQLVLEAIPGTLINAYSFKSRKAKALGEKQFVKFGPYTNRGRPLPMGRYKVQLLSEGKVLATSSAFVAKDEATYEKRMKPFKENIQRMYDKKIGDIRELARTLDSLQRNLDAKEKQLQQDLKVKQKEVLWQGFEQKFNAILAQILQIVQTNSTPTKDNEVFFTDTYKIIIAIVQKQQDYSKYLEDRFILKSILEDKSSLMTEIIQDLQNLEKSISENTTNNPLKLLARLKAQEK